MPQELRRRYRHRLIKTLVRGERAEATLHRISAPSETTTGASGSRRCRRSLSRVADMISSLRSSRNPCWTSSSRAGQIRLQAALVKLIEDHQPHARQLWIALDHARQDPSVTTSGRVCGPTQVSARMRKPTVSPAFRQAVQPAAARHYARRRLGSSRIMRPAMLPSARSAAAAGRLPAPVGALSKTCGACCRADNSSGRTAATGNEDTKGSGVNIQGFAL